MSHLSIYLMLLCSPSASKLLIELKHSSMNRDARFSSSTLFLCSMFLSVQKISRMHSKYEWTTFRLNSDLLMSSRSLSANLFCSLRSFKLISFVSFVKWNIWLRHLTEAIIIKMFLSFICPKSTSARSKKHPSLRESFLMS